MGVMVLVFGACLLLFTLIGVASATRRQDTAEDYLLASRSVSPWLTALTSVATNNSGFMFVGLIGFTYRDGLSAVWMAVAWVLGDLLVWLFVHRRVRQVSGDLGVASVPAMLAHRPGGSSRAVAVAAGLLTILFLGGYAAAQLQAGAIAIEGLFGWDRSVGVVLGGLIVLLYCYAGGIRASIWTDATQAFVMLGSMLVLLAYAVAEVGGPLALHAALAAQDPALVAWRPQGLTFGFAPYFLGFLAGGLGAIGQPHILVRTMALRDASLIPRTRRIYFAWFVPFYATAVLVALYARAILPELAASADVTASSEGALPALSVALLPEALVGVMLAGLFSATMSTADSQILACSAAVTQDLAPSLKDRTGASKLATLGLASFALVLALRADDGVFALVLGAWSLLAASLGPLVVLRVYGREVPPWLALTMMAAGFGTVTAWGWTGLGGAVFDLLPGLVVPFALYGAWSATQGPHEAEDAVRDAV